MLKSRRSVRRALGLGVALAALGLISACAAAPAPARQVTVMGAGQALGQSDLTVVFLGYWVKDEDANTALLNSKARLADLIVQLGALGIAQADIAPSGTSVSTETILGPEGYPTDRLLYGVNQNLNITVREAGHLGSTLNTARQVLGAPYLYSVSVNFDASPGRRSELLAEAQANALAEAEASAQRLAQRMGGTLGAPAEVKVINQQLFAAQAQITLEVTYEIK